MEIYNGSYSVYIHVNKINNKCYVGITKASFNRRWGKNGDGYKTQTLFYRAIKKYGWDSFQHIIFAKNITQDEACNMQKILIRELKSNHRDYGYNVQSGGRCQTIQSRRKISKSLSGPNHHHYGKPVNEQTRRKISQSLSGQNHYWYGKHLPQSTRKKISESNKGRKKPEGAGTQPKKILCVQTGMIYPSTAQASRVNSVHHSSITMVLKGRRNTAGGFHWVYAEQNI